MFSELGSALIDPPSLVQTVMAVIVDNVSHVGIASRLDVEASLSVSSDVSSGSLVPLHELSWLV